MKTYHDCVKVGGVGVEMVVDYLQGVGDVYEISGALDQKEAGDLMVDCGDYKATVEVKSERSFMTGNLFLETMHKSGDITPGWVYMLTRCDILAYTFVLNNYIFLIGYAALYSWFQDNFKRFYEKAQGIGYWDQFKTTFGRVVPANILFNEIGKGNMLAISNGDIVPDMFIEEFVKKHGSKNYETLRPEGVSLLSTKETSSISGPR